MTTSASDLRQLAPEAFDAEDEVLARLGGAAPGRSLDLARRRITTLLDGHQDELPAASGGLADDEVSQLAQWTTSSAFSPLDRSVLELTEQFVIDVSAVSAEQRARCLGALGDDAFGTVQAIYVLDHGLRRRAALRQMFGVAGGATATSIGHGADLFDALEDWMRTVATLRSLDPLTTELVRLRGARAHDCRMCRSLRNVTAVDQGADEQVFDSIDAYETSDLSERHKVALRLTDAMLWRPTAIPEQVIAGVHELFEPAQALELVLDVGRNAANKIAVAFDADAANTEDGIEYYDVDGSGDLVYGLRPARP